MYAYSLCVVAPPAVTFFSFYRDGLLATDLQWDQVLLAVLLPLVGFLWLAFQRRERCLEEVSTGELDRWGGWTGEWLGVLGGSEHR